MYPRYLYQLPLLLIFWIAATPVVATQVSPSSKEVVRDMIQATEKIRTFQCELSIQERVDGTLQQYTSFMKLRTDSFRVYLKQIKPSQGLEVLFVKGKNENKAAVNPNGFPWFTLWLDPMGYRMRKDRHHHIYHSGFDFMASIVNDLMNRNEFSIEKVLFNRGLQQERGFTCYKIVYNSPNFQYYSYKVGSTTTVNAMARKLKISAYKIIEENSDIDYYGQSLEPGQQVRIPSEYAKTFHLYIDKKTMLPVTIRVWDDRGLYEEYKYSSIKLNPEFDAQTFSTDNPEYNF